MLIVEDDNATRYILSRQLSQTGAIVTLVEDAEAALAIIRASTVDVLVIDLKLSGLDGFQVLARISSRPLVTIAVTAFDDNEMRERAAAAGFQCVPRKAVRARDTDSGDCLESGVS